MLPSLSRRMTAAAVKPSTLLPLTSPPLHASLFDSTTSFTPAATTARVLHLRRPRPRWLSTGVPQDEVKEGGPPRKKQPSFSFSGAGFLSPFHIGVVQALKKRGIITPETKLAGASGGALVAGSTVCGISPADQMAAYKEMAGACRAAGFLGKVRGVLHKSLEARLPEDAHERANRRLTIAVMRVWPSFSLQPELLEYFHSRQDLLDSLITSSHLPLYIDAAQPFWTRFRSGFYVDGGLVDLVPPVPGSIKVCVFPGHYLFRDDLHVTPHLLSKGYYPFSLQQIMKWAFVAPPDDVADELQRMGHQAAVEWVKTGGIEEGREIDLARAVTEEEKVPGAVFVPPHVAVGLGSNSSLDVEGGGKLEDKVKKGEGG